MRRINSRENPHYKALKRLSESGRERRKSGRVLLDGMHLIEAYGRHCGAPEEILLSDSGAGRPEIAGYLAGLPAGSRRTLLPDALFADLALVDTPSGIMAVAPWPTPARAIDHAADTVVLDGIQDPGNVGSILRSAAAAGFRQILLSVDCAQVWSPKTLRAAMGAHFQLDIHEGCDLPGFLAPIADTLWPPPWPRLPLFMRPVWKDRWPGSSAVKGRACARQCWPRPGCNCAFRCPARPSR
jgi:TrmH family RNA methyltransferase